MCGERIGKEPRVRGRTDSKARKKAMYSAACLDWYFIVKNRQHRSSRYPPRCGTTSGPAE
jgi:hypothetical protein